LHHRIGQPLTGKQNQGEQNENSVAKDKFTFPVPAHTHHQKIEITRQQSRMTASTACLCQSSKDEKKIACKFL
jgi:hypothetical protein